jgi:hypothetical protein
LLPVCGDIHEFVCRETYDDPAALSYVEKWQAVLFFHGYGVDRIRDQLIAQLQAAQPDVVEVTEGVRNILSRLITLSGGFQDIRALAADFPRFIAANERFWKRVQTSLDKVPNKDKVNRFPETLLREWARCDDAPARRQLRVFYAARDGGEPMGEEFLREEFRTARGYPRGTIRHTPPDVPRQENVPKTYVLDPREACFASLVTGTTYK